MFFQGTPDFGDKNCKSEPDSNVFIMSFHAHTWFSVGKINVKLAYTYWGRTKIYFLKWVVEEKSLRSLY